MSPSHPTASSTAINIERSIRPSWRRSPVAPDAPPATAPSAPPADALPFDTEVARALESHTFEPIKTMQWRNTALDFASIGALQASLAETPKEACLTRAPVGEDILVLDHAGRDDEIRALATSRQAVERLWDVCQVPDYRKISPATHAELATTLYGFLMRQGVIPTDWFARQVDEADRTEGDIDTLSNRIAHIRTWTFAANRPDWLADPEHWQGVTRAVEDKLSDALHERLTERFVDRRTSVLMRRLRENTLLEADISKSGEVVVEGHAIGRLDGFMFTPESSALGSQARALAGAAQKSLAGEINARATRLSQAADVQFVLTADASIRWLGQPVGKLVAGEEVLKPRVRIIADEHLTGAPRDAVQARLDLWLKSHIERLLEPLFRLAAADDITGIARGVAFQLCEMLGVLDRQKVADEVKGLDQPSRATLRKHGVRFGAYHVYVPALLKPAPRVLATQLWALKHGGPDPKGLEVIEHLAASGRTSIAADKDLPKALYRIAGYRVCGERAVRVDILERLADLIRPALAWRPGASGPKPPGAIEGFGFTVSANMMSLAGCSGEDFASVLRSLGYRMEKRPKPIEPPPAPMAAEPAAEIADPTPPASSGEHPHPDPPPLAAEGRDGAEAERRRPIGRAGCRDRIDRSDRAGAGTRPAAMRWSRLRKRRRSTCPSRPNRRWRATALRPRSDRNPEPTAPELIEVWRPHVSRPRAERRPPRPIKAAIGAAASCCGGDAAKRWRRPPKSHRRAIRAAKQPVAAGTSAAPTASKAAIASRVRNVASVPRVASVRSARASAASDGPAAPIAAIDRTTIRSCARNTSRAAPRAEIAATASPIRIRRSPSWPRSRSSSRRIPRISAEASHAWIASLWIANASTNGSGTHGWCARVLPRRHSPPPVMCGSTVSVSLRPLASCARAMW